MAMHQSINQHSQRLSHVGANDRRTSERPSIIDSSLFRSRTSRRSFQVKIYRQPDNDSSSNESDDSALLAVTSKAWKMYRASPLFGFNNNASSLKSYGRLLKNHLQSQRIDSKKDIHYDVKFTVLNGLKGTVHDSDALQVQVFSVSEGMPPVVLYLGILLSWGGSRETISKHFVYLPLLLCISSLTTAGSVHGFLHKLFDCFTHPLELSQDDLMWLSAIANSKSERNYTSKRKVEFQYKCPQVPAGAVTIELHPNSLRDLWSKVHNAQDSQILHEEVYKFHRMIGEQLIVVHKMNHCHLQLSQFIMPNMSMSLGGRFRVRTIEAAEYVLSYLHILSRIVEGPNPTLSVPS